MVIKPVIKLSVLGVALAALAGCATHDHYKNTSSRYASAQGTTSHSVAGPAQFEDQDAKVAWVDAEQQPIGEGKFFFDFDKAALHQDEIALLKQHADYLKANPDAHIRIEGHTDERGTREYNIALGERRAKTVDEYLLAEGVPQKQMSVVSFGEEKPLEQGHDELAYSKNRRAVIVYETTA